MIRVAQWRVIDSLPYSVIARRPLADAAISVFPNTYEIASVTSLLRNDTAKQSLRRSLKNPVPVPLNFPSSFTISLPNKTTRFVLRAGQTLSFVFPKINPPDGVIRIKTCSNMHTGGSV